MRWWPPNLRNEAEMEAYTDDHLTTICDGTLSNKDRLELLYRRSAKERRGLTKDEFFGLLLDGKWTV